MSAFSSKDKFETAVKVIHSLPKNGGFQPSYDLMLKFYGLFKQAKVGPCTMSRPAFWDVVGRAKWDAWHKLGDMGSEEAMDQYVNQLKSVIETMPHTQDVSSFIGTLSQFYEMVDDGLDPPNGTLNGRERMLKDSLRLASKLTNGDTHEESVASPISIHIDQGGLANGDVEVPMTSPQSEDESSASFTTCNGAITSDTESDEEFCDTTDRCVLPIGQSQFSYMEPPAPLFEGSSSRAVQRIPSSDVDMMSAIRRLQTDLDLLSARLTTLEMAANHRARRERWWPFSDGAAARTVLLVLAWPLVLQLLYWLIRRRRRQRR